MAVANAADGFDDYRARRLDFDFFAKHGDVLVEGAAIGEVIGAPASV